VRRSPECTQVDDPSHAEKGRRRDWSLDAQCARQGNGPKPTGRRRKTEHRACRCAEHRWKLGGVDRGRELRRGTRQDCGWKKGGKLTEQIRRLGAVGRAFVAEQTRDRDRGAQPRGGDERTEEKPRRRGRGK
jgi:hypothetical protein